MASYFLDTSALVKRQVGEVGHRWVRSLVHGRAGHTIAIAEVALVEVVASLCRMRGEQPPRLAIADRTGSSRAFVSTPNDVIKWSQ